MGNLLVDASLGIKLEAKVYSFLKLYTKLQKKYVNKNIFLDGASGTISRQYAVEKHEYTDKYIFGFDISSIDNYNFIFEYSAGEEYRLVLKKRRYNKERDEYKKVNLFALVPRGDSLQTMVMKDVPVQDETDLVFLVSRDGVRPE